MLDFGCFISKTADMSAYCRLKLFSEND